jgi:hypothetical protein
LKYGSTCNDRARKRARVAGVEECRFARPRVHVHTFMLNMGDDRSSAIELQITVRKKEEKMVTNACCWIAEVLIG